MEHHPGDPGRHGGAERIRSALPRKENLRKDEELLRKRIWILLLLLGFLLAGCAGREDPAGAQSPCRLALIAIDSVDPHWQELKAGADRAAEELGVELTFLAPAERSDEQQLALLEQALEDGCQAVLLAANSPDALSPALNAAVEAGVKLIYVDSPAETPAEATFCTDNHAAGITAGQTLLWELNNRGITSGRIGIRNVNDSTESTLAREAGFREAFAGTGFTLLETRYTEGDPERSQTIARDWLTHGVTGIFGCNGGTTLGIGNAVRDAQADIPCVGFDKSEDILELIRQGHILAAMAQNPDTMGYEGVRAAVAALKGEALGGAVTDTGISVLTAASEEAAEQEERHSAFRIALITMDSVDQHWMELKAGAEKAAGELEVELTFLAPANKDEGRQAALVNQAVASGCDAIVLAASGTDILSGALLDAVDAGVKLVYVDSPGEVRAEVTFCTDNHAAGLTAGQTMLSELNRRNIFSGRIGIINVDTVTSSGAAREAGFREAFQGTAFELLDTRYGEGDAACSQALARNFLSQDVVGIFGCNEGSTLGAGNAVAAAGADIVCVGFDRTEAILNLIEGGHIYAVMTQNPNIMDYEGIRAAVAVLSGEDLRGVTIDTGVSVLVG